MIINLVFFSNYTGQMVPTGVDLIIYMIALSPVFILTCAQGVKRCHDTGISGWYLLIPGGFLYLLIKSGVSGQNRYGEDPQNYVKLS